MSNVRTCVSCNMEKPLTDFPPTDGHKAYKAGKAGHEKRCRPCKAAYARAWRSKNKGYRGTGKLAGLSESDRLLASAISARLSDARARATKYNQEFAVDRDYLLELFKAQEGKCALSGVTLKIEKKAFTCLSLDQVHPGLGYIPGNVQWLAWAVNRAKGDMDTDVFVSMCEQVLEYRKVQRLSKGTESEPSRVGPSGPKRPAPSDRVMI